MAIPHDAFDSTVPLLREGYEFVRRRCRRHGSDAFRTRVGLRPVVCASGRDAAAMFYAPDRFTRRRALPPTAVSLLQDYPSVQALDGAAHHARKATWMRMAASPEAVATLRGVIEQHWSEALPTLSGRTVTLYDEAHRILVAASAEWAGTPLAGAELDARDQECKAMVQATAKVGPGQLRAQLLRRRTEKWARTYTARALADPSSAPEGTPLRALAEHHEADGRSLTAEEAGVEIINCVRASGAVARWVAHAAVQLHEHPEWRERLRATPGRTHAFVQEVRRHAPFIPFMGGVAREAFAWRGEAFEPGDWVLLDIYGTNRDPAVWDRPDEFDPTRFEGHEPGPCDLVANGGGPYETTHRCPGERATITLAEAMVHGLVALDYALPDQDLSCDLARLPTLPNSGVVMEVA